MDAETFMKVRNNNENLIANTSAEEFQKSEHLSLKNSKKIN